MPRDVTDSLLLLCPPPAHLKWYVCLCIGMYTGIERKYASKRCMWVRASSFIGGRPIIKRLLGLTVTRSIFDREKTKKKTMNKNPVVFPGPTAGFGRDVYTTHVFWKTGTYWKTRDDVYVYWGVSFAPPFCTLHSAHRFSLPTTTSVPTAEHFIHAQIQHNATHDRSGTDKCQRLQRTITPGIRVPWLFSARALGKKTRTCNAHYVSRHHADKSSRFENGVYFRLSWVREVSD